MPQYIVFAVDSDEDAWEAASPEEREANMQHDYAFGKLLEERGGKLVGGADLAHTRETRVLRAEPEGGTIVTDGPYETAEHISGFYIVECDDLDILTEAASLMAPGHTRLEIRPRPKGDQ